MTLFFSVRHTLAPLVIVLAFLELAVVQHVGWAWVVVAGFGVFAVLATRRIDLSSDAISFTPLLPLLGRQALAWEDLGPFERSRLPRPHVAYDFVKAPVTGPARFRVLWLVPSRTVTVATVFAQTRTGRALSAQELIALTESVRRR
jgi:hypothetical protein